MTYDALIGCPANGYGDGRPPSQYAGPLLDCSDGHDRVTWRGPEGDHCFVCEHPGRMVGYSAP